MEDELRQNEASFTPRFQEAELIKDPAERKLRIDSLHNSFSTKQSIIRKKYGVRLRVRRTKAEIDGERQRLGLKHSSPSQTTDMPSNKRQRTGQHASHPSPLEETPSKHLAVSDINSGLGGSSATAALSDPTNQTALSDLTNQAAPQNSLSSYQRKGYRVSSSHVPQRSSGSATPVHSPSDQLRGSASAPVILDGDDSGGDSSDGDSDSDEEIPASLPLGGRKTGEPAKGLAG